VDKARIPESPRWEQANLRRQAALERERSGALLQAHERALTRFTLLELFAEREVRRRTLIAFAMSLATTLAWWGISAWLRLTSRR